MELLFIIGVISAALFLIGLVTEFVAWEERRDAHRRNRRR